MSNSKRAQERRLKREHMKKQQRDRMARQHWGNHALSPEKQRQRQEDGKLASYLKSLGFVK